MYCLCSSIYRTELLKSKLPVMSLFLCDENHVARYAILAARYENHVKDGNTDPSRSELYTTA